MLRSSNSTSSYRVEQAGVGGPWQRAASRQDETTSSPTSAAVVSRPPPAAPVFEQIISLVNVRQTRWQDGSLHVGGLMDDFKPGDDIAPLRAQVQSGTAAKVVSAKGDYSLVLLRTGFIDQADVTEVYHALTELAKQHGGPEFRSRLPAARRSARCWPRPRSRPDAGSRCFRSR